jgi:hypothetical protein
VTSIAASRPYNLPGDERTTWKTYSLVLANMWSGSGESA